MNLFLRVGLCIHFPNFQRKNETIAYLSILNNHRHLTNLFLKFKNLQNTCLLALPRARIKFVVTTTADVANSKKGSYKFTFQMGTSCVAPLLLFSRTTFQ